MDGSRTYPYREGDGVFCTISDKNLHIVRMDQIERNHRDSTGIPLNRTRFDNQLTHLITDWNLHFNVNRFRSIHMSEDDFINEAVPRSVEGYRSLVELVNREDRTNWAIVNSMIYPDLYQFHLGRQNAATTLTNIQNRLMLYFIVKQPLNNQQKMLY